MKYIFKTVTASDEKYGILQSLTKLDMPLDQEVFVYACSECYGAIPNSYNLRTHASQKGRIDHLSKLYHVIGLKAGDVVQVSYEGVTVLVFKVLIKTIQKAEEKNKMLTGLWKLGITPASVEFNFEENSLFDKNCNDDSQCYFSEEKPYLVDGICGLDEFYQKTGLHAGDRIAMKYCHDIFKLQIYPYTGK